MENIPQPNLFHFQRLLDELAEVVPAGKLSNQQISKLIQDLPRIEEKKLVELNNHNSFCPICLTQYLAILAEEELALAMNSPAHPVEELGVTRLSQPWQCGHMFCRRDISKWITGGHDSCPMCRKLLIQAGSNEDPAQSTNQDVEAQFTDSSQLLQQVFGIDNMPEEELHLNLNANRLEYSGMYS